MLSLAPADDGYRLDVGQIPMWNVGEVSSAPAAGGIGTTPVSVAPSASGRYFDLYVPPTTNWPAPAPPSTPWLPPEKLPPDPPPPAGDRPDAPDAGEYMDIGEPRRNEPSVLVQPAMEKTARQVLDMLDSLQYVPSASDDDVQLPREFVSPLQNVPEKVFGADRAENRPEGGMVALLRDAVIVQAAAKHSVATEDLHSWLNLPVRIDSAPSKFHAFEVSAGEEPPPAPPVRANDPAPPLQPRATDVAPPDEATPAPQPDAADVTDARAETGAEWIADRDAPAILPPEAADRYASTRSAAAAAVVVLLALRAARGGGRPNPDVSAGRPMPIVRRPRPTDRA
jgi:hypothetical protein